MPARRREAKEANAILDQETENGRQEATFELFSELIGIKDKMTKKQRLRKYTDKKAKENAKKYDFSKGMRRLLISQDQKNTNMEKISRCKIIYNYEICVIYNLIQKLFNVVLQRSRFI